MAGEKVLRAHHYAPSIDVVAEADVARGDVLTVGDLQGFALAAAVKGAPVAVCFECHRAEIPQPATARAWAAGTRVGLAGTDLVPVKLGYAAIGYVHHEAAATDARVSVVWRPEPGTPTYSYFRLYNPQTTPAFGFAAVTATTAVPMGGEGWQTSLHKSSSLGLIPGVPLTVDYEGDLLWAFSKKANMRVSVGYVLWPDVPARRIEIWRRSWRSGGKVAEQGISMDSFSSISVLDVGSQIPKMDGSMVTITAQDFVDGIPIEILVQLRPFNDTSLTRKLDGALSHIELLHGQVVSHQSGTRKVTA